MQLVTLHIIQVINLRFLIVSLMARYQTTHSSGKTKS